MLALCVPTEVEYAGAKACGQIYPMCVGSYDAVPGSDGESSSLCEHARLVCVY